MLALALAATPLVPHPASADTPTLYAVTGSGGDPAENSCNNGTLSSLYTLDPTTGAATKVADVTIGGTQIRNVYGLAVDPTTGTLYGFMNGQAADCTDWSTGTLITIDKTTGAATIVGTQGAADFRAMDITFDPFGTLYAWSEAGHCDPGYFVNCADREDLYTVDTATGVGTRVADCECGTFRTGLADDSRGRLFVKDHRQLHLVNPFTGHVDLVSTLTQNAHDILAFGPGDVLNTGHREGAKGFTLLTVDLDSGATTAAVTSTVTNISALAWDLGTYTPPAVSDLSIDKSVDQHNVPELLTDVVFSITVSNAGPDTATGVEVLDQLPDGFSYVSDDGGGAYDPATGVWTIGSIAVGSPAVLHITATVQRGGSNTAEVISMDNYDPDSVPASGEGDTIDSTTVSTGGLDADFDALVAVILKGGTLASNAAQKFTVLVTNVGEAPLPLSRGDVDITVNDNSTVVTCKAFSPTTIKSGSSKKLGCSANVAALGLTPGQEVIYRASVDVPPDGFVANDTDAVHRNAEAVKPVAPTGNIDANLDVVVKGATPASATAQPFTVLVINAGEDPLSLSSGDVDVTVNGDGSVVSCKPFSATTLKSGSSKKIACTANIATLGLSQDASVIFSATIDAASDGNEDNDAGSVFRSLA